MVFTFLSAENNKNMMTIVRCENYMKFKFSIHKWFYFNIATFIGLGTVYCCFGAAVAEMSRSRCHVPYRP